MRKLFLFVTAFIMLALVTHAKEPGDSLELLKEQLKRMDSIENALHYKTGRFELGSGIASINVPAGFKFLDSAEARYVIEDLWGNPPGQKALGALFPASSGATDPGSYAFIIEYDEIGYVKDKDAEKINYDDLLKK